jgi:hypothetical protein
MKWCRYQQGGAPSFGIIEGDTVVEVSGSPFARIQLHVYRNL